ncbi:MAG: T9SS type A sorting domain-containing protein [Chlorobi bacterium]|nr:T9SS type A sorting domain-containing protein [Chlorobiota bacterium]
MRHKTTVALLFILFSASSVFAQEHGNIEAMPRMIHFNDMFQRMRTIRVTNMGWESATVDSIVYDRSVFNIHLNDISGLPVTLSNMESFTFDLLLYNYFDLFMEDSAKVISIYNSGEHSPEKVKVNLQMDMMGDHEQAMVNGNVSDASSGLGNSKLYFFYDGNFLLDSTVTDINGDYSKGLPDGDYLIAASHDNYYMQFAYGKKSILDADFISVQHESMTTVNFVLEPEVETNISVSGVVVDNTNSSGLAKSVVIVTTGKHTPTKAAYPTDGEERTYAAITNSDGSYELKNIMSGTYYIQAFSGFLSPGYYNDENHVVHLWQDADTLEVFSSMNGRDVFLEPDSSYGGGEANGAVFYNGPNSEPVDDVVLYAINLNTDKIYSYNFSADQGEFIVNDLPYGEYKLVSEKIGYPNAESDPFEISSSQTVISDITLTIPVTSVEYVDAETGKFILMQNYPNPFNPSTEILYQLPERNYVSLKVYDILGNVIATLDDGVKPAGIYRATFAADSKLSSGIYFYTLEAGNFIQTKKMILLR